MFQNTGNYQQSSGTVKPPWGVPSLGCYAKVNHCQMRGMVGVRVATNIGLMGDLSSGCLRDG
jgi:hypothetical protein